MLEDPGSGNCVFLSLLCENKTGLESISLFSPPLFFRHRKVLDITDIVIRLRRQWDAALCAK